MDWEGMSFAGLVMTVILMNFAYGRREQFHMLTTDANNVVSRWGIFFSFFYIYFALLRCFGAISNTLWEISFLQNLVVLLPVLECIGFEKNIKKL